MKSRLMIILSIIILALLLIIPSKAQVYQANQWCGNFPDLPGNGAIFGHASVVLGDTIYVAGGSASGTPTSMVYRYSISGNIWSSGNNLPGNKAGGDLVAVRGKIYYIGGGNSNMVIGTNEQYVYNPANGTWSNIANISVPVTGNCAEVYKDSLIYCVFGGWASFETIVQVYNTYNNTWSTATSIPAGNGRRSFAAGLMGNKLFVCAGFDGSFRNDFWIGTINPANAQLITWQQKTNLAVPTSRPGGTAINGRFYVVIGELSNGLGSDSIAIWDTTTAAWRYVDGKPTRTNNLYSCTSSSIVVCNGRPGVKVWAVGGSIQNQNNRPLEVFADTCLTNCQEYFTGINGQGRIPDRYALLQNYPNPFNPVTKIEFELPQSGFVKLTVTDITGREVSTLINEFKMAGGHSINFDASSLSSGVYFYTIETNSFRDSKKMVLIK